MSDHKREAARQALSFIKNDQTVGLGAGSTIAYLVEMLSKEAVDGLVIKVVTSSFTTKQLLVSYNFNIIPVDAVSAIDIYFDGCDQLDKDLNALKSGGGIHTMEKLLACMATEFIILGDEGKLADQFDNRFPVVAEVLPQAFHYVVAKIQALFPGVKTLLRSGDKKDGAVITDNGNYLLELWFEDWPQLSKLNTTLKSITGIVETSLFYNLIHKAIIGVKDGVRILEKK